MEKWSHHYFNQQYLEYTDLLITPLFIGLIYFVINSTRESMLGANSPLKRFLLPALSLKIFGAIASGLVYQYYYLGGDTMDYYTSASFVSNLCFENFGDFLGLMNASPVSVDPQYSRFDFLDFLNDTPAWTLVRITALVDLVSFDSYPVVSVNFSLFSLFAAWKFFSLLCKLYPDPVLRQRFAYSMFYIPSVVFWGSGLFKDTLTMCGLFLFTVSIHAIVIRRELRLSHFIWLVLGFYLMVSIRIFYLVILVPCLMLWFFAEFRDKIIKSRFIRTVSFPVLMLFSVGFIVFGLRGVMGSDNEISADALKDKAAGFQSWHSSLGGSSYNLGITDFSTLSLLKAIPLGINVALFRPYIWETSSFFQMIAALQSLFFLYFTLRTIWRSGFSFFYTLTSDPFLLFTLPFSMMYSFIAGFTSYNFGALDRYKIPALPMYMVTLVLINYHSAKMVKEGYE